MAKSFGVCCRALFPFVEKWDLFSRSCHSALTRDRVGAAVHSLSFPRLSFRCKSFASTKGRRNKKCTGKRTTGWSSRSCSRHNARPVCTECTTGHAFNIASFQWRLPSQYGKPLTLVSDLALISEYTKLASY